MSRPYTRLIQNQAKVKVIAHAYNSQKEDFIWFLTLMVAALASIAYFFVFFFSFSKGRALVEN